MVVVVVVLVAVLLFVAVVVVVGFLWLVVGCAGGLMCGDADAGCS